MLNKSLPDPDASTVIAAARRREKARAAFKEHVAPTVARAVDSKPDVRDWRDKTLAIVNPYDPKAGHAEVHRAVEEMHQQGRFTEFQAQALKAHQGPLKGHQGEATVGAIALHMTRDHFRTAR